MSIAIPPSARRLAATVRADLPGLAGTPRLLRFLLAAVTAVVLSLLVCAVVAAATRAIVPALAGYEHLQVRDWAKLTVIGIVLGVRNGTYRRLHAAEQVDEDNGGIPDVYRTTSG